MTDKQVMQAGRNKEKPNCGPCVYCGEFKELTNDHVIPKTLFNVLDRDMITVSACKDCQQTKSLGDHDLRNFLVLHISGSRHPDNDFHLVKIIQESKNTRLREFIRRMVDNSEEAFAPGLSPYELELALRGEFNQERMYRTLRMVIRGLYFYFTGRILPQQSPVLVRAVSRDRLVEVARRVDRLKRSPVIIKGNNVALIVPWLDPENEESSCWFVAFFNWVAFLGLTGEAARKRQE